MMNEADKEFHAELEDLSKSSPHFHFPSLGIETYLQSLRFSYDASKSPCKDRVRNTLNLHQQQLINLPWQPLTGQPRRRDRRMTVGQPWKRPMHQPQSRETTNRALNTSLWSIYLWRSPAVRQIQRGRGRTNREMPMSLCKLTIRWSRTRAPATVNQTGDAIKVSPNAPIG
ncbi:hypothetical protein BJY04DRAFT_3351 [Aspergillus karnatakaensis]|uniref:uncharacterized protein n=1 Tax=Aspergillus karnatakaensis TaxID=1810916 RepID=UPI003CCDDEE9